MSNSFHDISKSIVTDFLQTAVIIDDKAFDTFERPKPEITNKPPRGRSMSSGKEASTTPRSISSHTLDAPKLMSSFAKKGLICTVLCPSEESDIEEEIKNTIITARRSDIVIVDWQIHHKHNGEIALQIINSILKKDGSPERTRFICIYTGSKDISTTIADKVKTEVFQNDESKFSFNNNELIFRKDSLIISIIAKKEIPLLDNIKHLSIPEEDLPEKIIDIYTKEFSGLMPNITMKALAAIRNNDHKILSRFNNKLDAPFLSHRCLLSPPDEAESHFVPQFKSEIESILNENKVHELLNYNNVEAWINKFIDFNILRKRMHIRKTTEAILELKKILKKGVSKISSRKYKNKNIAWGKLLSTIKNEEDKKRISDLTKLFTNEVDYEILDKEFAYILSTNLKYDNQIPILTSGSIISENKEGITKYFLCIQPSCDCYRISTTGRNFLFIPLKIDDVEEKRQLVIMDDEEFLCLNYKLCVFNIEKLKFIPDKTNSPIIAHKKDNKWIFTSDSEIEYNYLSTLKNEFAQKISNDFAHEISRVGITQSEWLRRWAK